MSTTELSITQVRAEWQRMRQLYSFYAALNERFGLGVAPFSELASAEDTIPDLELLESARQWMSGIDNKATAFNLRQLMHSIARSSIFYWCSTSLRCLELVSTLKR